MSQPSVLALTFNHVVLPPKLPGEKDIAAEDVNRDLTSRLLDALELLMGSSSDDVLPVLGFVQRSLRTCQLLNENEFVNKAVLLDAFQTLETQAIILRITEQNAGLIIRHACDQGESVIFEAFETSPMARQTLAARGALKWDFPGVAVSLPLSEFEKPAFQESLACFIEKASLEPLDEFAAKTRKAGAEIAESRDTVDPAMITQFLMTLLEINGSLIYPLVLQKRIKDDVCWDKSELPWRRSPYWLVLRVAVQRLLYLALGQEVGRVQYKFLMCALLSRLLTDSVGFLQPELCDVLKAKLCRRLAKLEAEKANSTSSVRGLYAGLFQTLGPFFQQTVDAATAAIENEWNVFKKRVQRKIPALPFRAHEHDLRLSLLNSTPYFDEVLKWSRNQVPVSTRRPVNLATFDSKSKSTTENFASFSAHYHMLTDMELAIESRSAEIPTSEDGRKTLCIQLSKQIENYLGKVGGSYDGNPEQMSVFILNVFDLWVQMDRCATFLYPLLRDYHPFFRPEILDVLILSQRSDMERLHKVQLYLHERCARAFSGGMTILADPAKGCFADRYFETGNTTELRDLQRRIELASLAAQNAKKRELQKVNNEFTTLSEQKSQSICTQRRHDDGSHDIRGCKHCWYVRCRRRLKIGIHEDFLPQETHLKRAIVFELDIPKVYSTYRSTTWNIINVLCPKTPIVHKPEMLLHDYSQLEDYSNKLAYPGISLASNTKSHLGTHYNWKSLPAHEINVLRPFGLTFAFYDSKRKIWSKDLPTPLTLAHHFKIILPKELPFAKLYASPAFAADGPGPSSYETIASMPRCPSELTIHEYTAHQNLISGRNRRWFTILAELGSSNMNFSTQETMVLFTHLALQAGPREGDDSFRAVHSIFRDPHFCSRLIEQIDKHVETISANWRESNYMETLLTLTIRLCSLCCQETSTQAKDLLMKIRCVTLKWITLLQNETRNADEADIVEKAAQYAFRAALLCRRTLFFQASSDMDLDSEAFGCFVEASLAMQENLVVDLSRFLTLTRNMLVRDVKMNSRIKLMLRKLVMRYPANLESAMNAFWPHANSRLYTDWDFLPPPFEWWIRSTVEATQYSASQTVHYHLLSGNLLVDGKPLGKLPSDIRDSEILKGMFGNQRLVAFPSNLPGMSYVLGSQKENNEIHLGYRGNQLVIRARTCTNTILEYIPPNIFGNSPNLDLPSSLINDCVHWLDIWSGVLHIRRTPRIWETRPGDWKIDLQSRNGWRRTVSLVDPRSRLFTLIAQIFCDFEQPQMLTVFQPQKGNLSVELKRMDLNFYVNQRGLLHCRELVSEVDPNQDIGTLYGLKSMLVFRDARNRSQRSVIVTLGRV